MYGYYGVGCLGSRLSLSNALTQTQTNVEGLERAQHRLNPIASTNRQCRLMDTSVGPKLLTLQPSNLNLNYSPRANCGVIKAIGHGELSACNIAAPTTPTECGGGDDS